MDQWFDLKTQGLTDIARAQLKQRWDTMQKVLSARDRLETIVADIMMDMATRDRLKSGHGNAMLVSGSIYSACCFFEMFQRTDLAGKCAIITSYQPLPADIKGEETGEGLTENLRQYDIYRKMLAVHFDEPEDTALYKVERFEQEVKKRFVEEPGQMKLLIVVDKLLTGFDAPPATYLYIDKNMQDHGLFQAICRVNRLDGEDKEHGYIVDYKDLFRSLEQSIKDYTGEAFAGYDKADVEALLKDNEPRRVALYKLAASYLRAYANLANEMHEAGYTQSEARAIKAEVDHYEKVREEVKLASGDYVDMKMYKPAMRHLLDTYIRAEESEKPSAFDDLTLVKLIVERGEQAVEALPTGLRENREAIAETIENNVRRLIIDEMAVNLKYYKKMSGLLDALIKQRKREAMDYKTYLAEIVELTKKIGQPESPYGAMAEADGRKEQAIALIRAISQVKKADWRENRLKEREVRNAIKSELGDVEVLVDAVFEIVKAQRDY